MLCVAAPYWRSAGLELDVLETSASPGHFGQRLREAGYKVHRLKLDGRLSDVTRLRHFLSGRSYDVVHVHPEQADVVPALACRLAGVPAVVRTVHHIFPYDGLLRYRKRLERKLNRALGTKYICNSRSGSANEERVLHNPHRLVFNWYDAAKFRPPTVEERKEARRELGVQGLAFVSVGGCADYKNHDMILHTLPRLPDAQYFHVGPEVDDNERKLANHLGVSDRAHFLGVVPDVTQVLYAADAYVMPSSLEGFGIAAIEAMGCGLPVILGDRPALSDLKDLVPGTWVPLELEALVQAMQVLAEKPASERRDLGMEASAAVRMHFRMERGAAGYLAAYREALNNVA